MATPLASFFTKIGFEVDKSSLSALDRNLSMLESRVRRMADSFKSISNSPTLKAARDLANAEARRVQAEGRIAAIRNGVAKAEAEVERLRQQNLQQARKARAEAKRDKVSSTSNPRQTFNSGGRGLRVAGDPLLSVGNFKTFVGIETLRRFAMQSYNVANFQVAQQPQFEFLTGSPEKAQEQIDFVNKEVDRLSLNLQDANNQYRQLLAAGGRALGVEQTQKLFTNVQNLSTMLGLGTDAQNRAFKALAQMASKGTVQLEELNFRLAA